MQEWLNSIINGDSLSVLKTLPDELVDCTITSPPYWGLRDYGVSGQIGLESTFQEYVSKMVSLFHEVKRVTKKTGCLWLNLGDTYSGSNSGAGAAINPSSLSFKGHQNHAMPKESIRGNTTLPDKCQLAIPERIMLGLIDDGWIRRNAVIWHKPNHMPSSVKDRLTNSYELLYFFVKSQRYFFDLDKIREPNEVMGVTDLRLAGILRQKFYSGSQERYSSERDSHLQQFINPQYKGKFSTTTIDPEAVGSPRARELRNWKYVPSKNANTYKGFNERWKQKHGTIENAQIFGRNGHSGYYDLEGNLLVNPLGKNPGDLWKINTRPYKEAHFATYPMELVYRPMIASSPPNGVILDPFAGSGTTLAVAKMLSRKWVGIELNPKYIKLAYKRLAEIDSEARIVSKLIEPRMEYAGALDKFLMEEVIAK